MSILLGSNVMSNLLWILLLAMVTGMRANHIAGRFNGGSYAAEGDLGESENPSRMDYDASGKSANFADFPINHRRHPRYHRLELPVGHNLGVRPKDLLPPMDLPRPHHRPSHQTWKSSPDSVSRSEMRELRVEEPAEGKPSGLPDRFSYVAQQFYQYVWEKRNNAKKDERESAEGERNWSKDKAQGNGNAEDGKDKDPVEGPATAAPTDEPVDPVILWRNIIGAPPNSCPPGQQKDMNGRCRTAIW